MTTVSLNFRQAAYAQETGRVPIALITFTHDDLTDPIRISCDPTERIHGLTTDEEVVYGTVSNGNDYIFLPVRLKLPDDTDEGPGEMQIEIDNIHRDLTATIRGIHTPVTCNVSIVMDNALDTVELSWPEFRMVGIQYTAATISATLQMELLEREPYPAGSFTPSHFPGLFR